MDIVLASCCFTMQSTEDAMERVFRGAGGAPLGADEALQLLHRHVPRARVARAYVREVARLCDALSVRPVCAAAALLAGDEDGVPLAAAGSPRTRAYVAATNHRICQCAKLCQAVAKACLRGPGGANISALLLQPAVGTTGPSTAPCSAILRQDDQGVEGNDGEEVGNDGEEEEEEEEEKYMAAPSRVLTYLLVEVLNSPCRELRAEVARILHIVATRASAACRAVVAAELQNILVAVAWEQQWHRGVREVVFAVRQLLFPEDACAAAQLLQLPAPRTSAWVLAACILPLHHCRDAYRLCADQLAETVVAACRRGVLAPVQLAHTLCRRRCFQTAPNESQVHMLSELQLVLETVATENTSNGTGSNEEPCQQAVAVFAQALAGAVQSHSVFVCDRALAFVRAPVVLRCLVAARVLPAVLPGIVRTSEGHWDVRVRSLALVTMQHLRRTNNAYVNEILATHSSRESS